MQRCLYGLIIILISSSCSTIQINYHRDRILKKYSDDYKIYLDSSLIELKNYYLDRNNVKSVVRDKSKKAIYIDRDSMIEFLEFKEYFLEIKNDRMVILNGIPVESEKGKNLKVSPKSLMEITVLKNDSINSQLFHRNYKDVIIFRIQE